MARFPTETSSKKKNATHSNHVLVTFSMVFHCNSGLNCLFSHWGCVRLYRELNLEPGIIEAQIIVEDFKDNWRNNFNRGIYDIKI